MTLHEAILEALSNALGEHARALGDLQALLGSPPKREMGDVSFPCFGLAKIRKQAPATIASDLAATLAAAVPEGSPIARVLAVGPYVNFFADVGALLEELRHAVHSGAFFERIRTDEPSRVMVEFSQPNTHKLFHVGHLRNVALGDALVRIFRARGHDVVPVNYYGDFGVDVAKCLWWLRNHPNDKPPAGGDRMAFLGDAYARATAQLAHAKENDPDRAKVIEAELRTVLAGMDEAGSDIRALYEETRGWCLDGFKEIYNELDVHFEHDFYESTLEEPGQKIVADYLEKGVFEHSQGAVICDLTNEKLGACLVQKSDGSSLYMTWDLALARAKFDTYDIERSIYVVDAGQSHHFRQLFATLKRMGYERASDCHHVAYELVMLPEGKMSSRKGTATPYHILRRAVIDAIRAKMSDSTKDNLSADEQEDVAWRVAVACLKFGMLNLGNTKRVLFDLDPWTHPEGATGAYLLYSLARISGILRKAAVDEAALLSSPTAPAEEWGHEKERELLNHVQGYPAVVRRAAASYDPSALASFLYDGARAFGHFYAACPVLNAEPALRAKRLQLAALVRRVFVHGLDLLGIQPVEAM